MASEATAARATCLVLARTREAMRNSCDKNDPKDGQVVLHPLKTGLAQKPLYPEIILAAILF